MTMIVNFMEWVVTLLRISKIKKETLLLAHIYCPFHMHESCFKSSSHNILEATYNVLVIIITHKKKKEGVLVVHCKKAYFDLAPLMNGLSIKYKQLNIVHAN